MRYTKAYTTIIELESRLKMGKIRKGLLKIKDIIKYRLWILLSLIKEHKKGFFLSAITVLILASGIFYFLLRTYHDYEVLDVFERQGDTSANYYFSEDGILCCSKDGVSFSDLQGNTLWNQVFSMVTPKLYKNGESIVVGDVGANVAYLFGKKGIIGTVDFEKPLQDIRISKQGVIAAILSDERANQINLYSKKGELLVSIKATISTTGYPLTFAISENASKLVVSYISFETGKACTKLVFYDFTDKETSGTPVGEIQCDEFIPKIEFIDSNNVLACGEQGFSIYSFGSVVSEKKHQSFADDVKSVFLTEKYFGVITKNPDTGENSKKYYAEIFKLNGNRKAGFDFDFDYKNVTATDREVIFSTEKEVEVYTYHGHKKFEYAFEHDVEIVHPGKEDGTYIVLDADHVQTIKIK